MQVILKRGGLGDRAFPPESSARAHIRAESLAWLHSAEIEYGYTIIIVDASKYYDRKK